MHVDPNIIRASIDRFIALGCMPPPKKSKYKVNREDLNTSTDEEKANLALKWTQAMSQVCRYWHGPSDQAIGVHDHFPWRPAGPMLSGLWRVWT